MPDAIELVKIIKKAAIDAVEASKPVNVCFGKVTGIAPLEITVEQKLHLGAAQLALTRNVTDYKTVIRRAGMEREETTVYNGLAVGEKVVLIREQGGQKYIVVDRSA